MADIVNFKPKPRRPVERPLSIDDVAAMQVGIAYGLWVLLRAFPQFDKDSPLAVSLLRLVCHKSETLLPSIESWLPEFERLVDEAEAKGIGDNI